MVSRERIKQTERATGVRKKASCWVVFSQGDPGQYKCPVNGDVPTLSVCRGECPLPDHDKTIWDITVSK